jgi:cysteine desulfurase/selenocysteine lyase
VAVRGGHHCARPLSAALGLEHGSVRASIGLYTTEADVDALLGALDAAMAALR